MGRPAVLGTILLAGVLAFCAYRLFFYDPYVPAGEGGIFRNMCCGTVELADGDMLLNGRKLVRYVVGRDAEGAYVLPSFYVGAFPYRRFEVDGSARAMKLRLDRLPAPMQITLYQGETACDFKRMASPPAR
jgi:hypothetical protein